MLQTCSYILYSSNAIKTSWHHHHSLTIIHTRDRTYMWKRKRHHQQWSNFLHQWWWWWQRRRRCDGVIWDLSCFRQNRSTCQQDPRYVYVYLYRTTYDRVLSSRLQIWGNLIRNYFGWTLSDICLQFSQDIFKVNCFFVFFYIKIYKVY